MELKSILNFILVLIALYLLGFALLFFFQRQLIYFPTPAYSHGYTQISLQNEGVTTQVIVVNEGNANALIYFGGNAEAVIGNAQDFSLAFPDTTTYLVNYAGYGGSTGKPTQAGLFSDALAVYDDIKNNHSRIAVMGRSLGSGVAMHLAAHRPIAQVVLVTPYDSILALAQKRFPIYPLSVLLKDKFDSFALAKSVSSKILIIAGAKDTLIPNAHSLRLSNAFKPEQAQVIIIEGAGHNNISQFPIFYTSINTFFTEYKRQQRNF